MSGPSPWSKKVAVEEIPETGRHFDLVADPDTRARLAKAAGLRSLIRAEASFDVKRHGQDGLRVRGQVAATVGQDCIVTLDPLESDIAEEVDLVFMPEQAVEVTNVDEVIPVTGPEPPELLQNGAVDLGAIATEFLILGINPYPRKPDVVFEAKPVGEPGSHPFAALARLKERGAGGKKQ